ncbi:MAG: hypothetical protein JXR73_10045 [Candidatus Omnitrophica bacterium]|nr:hypothetical protein [Candidatus Omnitrophota bacterium]
MNGKRTKSDIKVAEAQNLIGLIFKNERTKQQKFQKDVVNYINRNYRKQTAIEYLSRMENNMPVTHRKDAGAVYMSIEKLLQFCDVFDAKLHLELKNGDIVTIFDGQKM